MPKVSICSLLLLVLASSFWFPLCLGAQAGADDDLLERVRHQLRIPQNYQLKLSPVEKTDIAGLVKRTLEVSGGPRPRRDTIYLSEDGRYLFLGRIYDLAQANPNRFHDIAVEGYPIRGYPPANVTIIVYSDFQCPFCERAYWTVKYKLLPRYGDQIRLIYKDSPLTQIHPWALKAAIGAQCAFEQGNGGFWRIHDLIFEHQDEITEENLAAKLREFAVAGDLDLGAFQECYETERTLPRIKASLAEAESLGLTGTPAFVVNGQLLSGAVPFSAFKSLIDRELTAPSGAGTSRK